MVIEKPACSVPRNSLLDQPYFQVLIGVIGGIILGVFQPNFTTDLKSLGDAIIALVKMILTPFIFLIVTVGIGGMGKSGELGSVVGKALILGEDRFMSECRALTNFIGNAAATIVVAGWEGELDQKALAKAMGGTRVTEEYASD